MTWRTPDPHPPLPPDRSALADIAEFFRRRRLARENQAAPEPLRLDVRLTTPGGVRPETEK